MMGNTNAYVYLNNNDEGSGFTLNENKKDIKQVHLPKTCKIEYTRPMIKFKVDGTPYPSGTTIKIIYKDIKKEITIVPISGRVLIKEGKYEVQKRIYTYRKCNNIISNNDISIYNLFNSTFIN